MSKNILLNDVRMDTQTAYFSNGDIHIYPCAYEADKAPILSEQKVSYRGRITMMESGETEVKRYNLGSQLPLYRKLYSTEHCEVIMSQAGNIYERWRFGKKLPIHQIWEIRKREMVQVDAFFKTLK